MRSSASPAVRNRHGVATVPDAWASSGRSPRPATAAHSQRGIPGMPRPPVGCRGDRALQGSAAEPGGYHVHVPRIGTVPLRYVNEVRRPAAPVSLRETRCAVRMHGRAADKVRDQPRTHGRAGSEASDQALPIPRAYRGMPIIQQTGRLESRSPRSHGRAAAAGCDQVLRDFHPPPSRDSSTAVFS